MGYLYLLVTVLCSVYTQVVIKWRLSLHENIPHGFLMKLPYFFKIIFTDFFILSGFFSAFLASIFWILAISKFNVSFAYPFIVSGAFILLLIFSSWFLREPITAPKLVGLFFIIAGITITSL